MRESAGELQLHKLALATLSLILLIGQSNGAFAGEFDGWCFPADECTGQDMPILNDMYSACETGCVLGNPTRVNNMDALLYDVSCSEDGSEPTVFRMFISKYGDDYGEEHTVAATKWDVTELVRCI